MVHNLYITIGFLLLTFGQNVDAQETVRIGLNRPESGPYFRIGLDQERAALLAAEEINAQGGILGHPIDLLMLDSQSKPDPSEENVRRLIDTQKVRMIFGGASSGVAIRVSQVCQEKGVVFMATVTAANATTGEEGHRHTFRTCYNAWMGAKALGTFLKANYPGKKYFYVVADYSWGLSAEESIRRFSGTEDRSVHKSTYTTFPGATEEEFRNKVRLAQIRGAEILVLAQFGNDMTMAVRAANEMNLKDSMQIVVPILELSMCEGAGPEAMEGIIGSSDWNWRVPDAYGFERGKSFVDRFKARYGRYPCWGAATAYTGLWQYKEAVERAGTFDAPAVIRALEGHTFTLLKDEQEWRELDHQNVQTVYLVRCRNAVDVHGSEKGLDYFENIDYLQGAMVVRTPDEWRRIRRSAKKPEFLEELCDE